jgi:hypothetical protein
MVAVHPVLLPVDQADLQQYLPLNDRKGRAYLVLRDLFVNKALAVRSMANHAGGEITGSVENHPVRQCIQIERRLSSGS